MLFASGQMTKEFAKILVISRGAGTGRQAGLKNPCPFTDMRVRLPPTAPFPIYSFVHLII